MTERENDRHNLLLDDQSHQTTSSERGSLHPSLSREGNIVKSLVSLDDPWDHHGQGSCKVTSVPDAVCRSLLRLPDKQLMVSIL